jgi:Membrane proteins related to metalloendopeptidases
MKKRFNGAAIARIAAAALCAVLLFASLPGGGIITTEAETTAATISKLQDQLKKNEAEQTALKSEITNTKSNINSMLNTKAYLDSQINLKQKNIDITTELIAQYEIEIENMKTSLLEKENKLNKEYESFRVQLKTSYEDKDTSYFELLFSSESLIDFLVNAERTSVLLDYEKQQLKDLDAQAEDLNNLKKSLEQETANQQAYKTTLESAKADLEQSRYDANQYIKNLSSQLQSSQTQYQELADQNAALDSELEKQLQALAAQSQKVYVGGAFRWPVDIGFNRISTGFEWRTLFGVTEFHKGIDIPANYGSNIYASNGGTVVTATYHSSYGNYIVIDHGGGIATLYAHCSKLLVKVGDVVSQGDVIGLVGSTGYSTGNHCHFEYRENGVAKNPLNYVTRP